MIGNDLFIQIGATRDGLDPYFDCAKQRGMQSILLETPSYLDIRKLLKRRQFDVEIPLISPADPGSILQSLQQYVPNISLMLAGFDRYNEATYAVAEMLKVKPFCENYTFHPMDKDKQRKLLDRNTVQINQPQYMIVEDIDKLNSDLNLNINYPVVIKPSNGAGGLGAYLVEDKASLLNAIASIQILTNYDGSKFKKIIIEEYIDGEEMSLQGVCINGEAYVIGCCKKIIGIEQTLDNSLKSFRENGHIAVPLHTIPEYIVNFAKNCASIFNYKNGAFHIDFKENQKELFFIEMGFRLSGGAIVDLVKRATYLDWPELSFSAVLGEIKDLDLNKCIQPDYVGLATLRQVEAVEKAYSFIDEGISIEVQTSNINLKKIAEQKALPKDLFADLSRHGSGIARMWVRSKSIHEVISVITSCQTQENLCATAG